MENKKIKLVTHDGTFHADDIFACAVLGMMLKLEGKEYEVIRTRDPKVIEEGDYVFDLGGEYSLEKNIFDHHQKGGAGKRENSLPGQEGIEYSSVGLIWKNFGMKLASSEKVWQAVDRRLISAIDAGDNGMSLTTSTHDVSPYYIQSMFGAMLPTWREDDANMLEIFLKCVELAKSILAREIVQAEDAIMAEEKVLESYKLAEDKKIIILDNGYPFEYIMNSLPEPLFVVYPKSTDGTWGVRAVRADIKTFGNRKNLPEAWAGLRDEELQKVTGVEDAIFCHRALFMAVARSREGAIKLAQIAVVS